MHEEEKHEREQIYFGWVWYEVQSHPATLTKLVVDGIVKVNYKSNRHTNYLLADRKFVSQALAKASNSAARGSSHAPGGEKAS